MKTESKLPVAVIGAGPVGLAAAAHLLERGEEPLVLEAGPAVGASIRQWAHVRLFSPWQFNVDTASAALLEAQGWTRPDPDEHPTGSDLLERYLEPLAGTPQLAPRIRLGTRVEAVGRLGFDKMKSPGRDRAPFVLQVRTADGRPASILARAVIDASGTWTRPNPLGAGGLPAVGEREVADRIFYGIPDVLGLYRQRYAGRTVLVVGSGHSAFNALLDLARLAEEEPGTSVIWAVRRPSVEKIFGGGQNDQLAARGMLGAQVRALLAGGQVRIVTDFKLLEIREQDGRLTAVGEHESIEGIDEIVGATGFRPDLELLREIRLDLDPAVESPSTLAPLIDPNLHSCGTVRPHGFEELKQPEKDFFVVGMKSYGRAPTFLLLTGYEQVRSIAAALTGDLKAAREVRLKLPETGVCSLSALPVVGAVVAAAQKTASCCAPTCCSKD
jgi:thioredoxin reductase